MASEQTDPRLEDVQRRVDEVRSRLPDNPGVTVIDDDDVPAYLDDEDLPEGGIARDEAPDDPDDHQAHAPG